jgi:hypothetical protein
MNIGRSLLIILSFSAFVVNTLKSGPDPTLGLAAGRNRKLEEQIG